MLRGGEGEVPGAGASGRTHVLARPLFLECSIFIDSGSATVLCDMTDRTSWDETAAGANCARAQTIVDRPAVTALLSSSTQFDTSDLSLAAAADTSIHLYARGPTRAVNGGRPNAELATHQPPSHCRPVVPPSQSTGATRSSCRLTFPPEYG